MEQKKQSILKNLYFLLGILIIIGLIFVFRGQMNSDDNTDQPLTSTPALQSVTNNLAAIETNPTADNYVTLGLAYYDASEFEKAIEATQQAILINPNDAIAYNNLGWYYSALNEWNGAIEAFNAALAINPDFDLASRNLEMATINKENEDLLINKEN